MQYVLILSKKSSAFEQVFIRNLVFDSVTLTRFIEKLEGLVFCPSLFFFYPKLIIFIGLAMSLADKGIQSQRSRLWAVADCVRLSVRQNAKVSAGIRRSNTSFTRHCL